MDERVKELFDKVKETAVIVGNTAGKTLNYAGKRTGDMVEATKLNMRIFDLNTEISLLYKELGRLLYETHTGGEPDPQELEDKLASIDGKNEEIASCKERIGLLKLSKTCPVCQELCGKQDRFCKCCGAELATPKE